MSQHHPESRHLPPGGVWRQRVVSSTANQNREGKTLAGSCNAPKIGDGGQAVPALIPFL